MGTILLCLLIVLIVAVNILLYVGYVVLTRFFKRRAYCKALKQKLKEVASHE